MARVLVYGSLRKGEENHYLLSSSALLYNEITVSGYKMYDCGRYPAAIPNERTSIIGELYDVDDEIIMSDLDGLEQLKDGLYHRYYDAKNDFYIYLKYEEQISNEPLIDSGDWVFYKYNGKRNF